MLDETLFHALKEGIDCAPYSNPPKKIRQCQSKQEERMPQIQSSVHTVQNGYQRRIEPWGSTRHEDHCACSRKNGHPHTALSHSPEVCIALYKGVQRSIQRTENYTSMLVSITQA